MNLNAGRALNTARLLIVGLLAAAALAACGGGASHPATSTSAQATTAAAGPVTSPGLSSGSQTPAGNVAVAAGTAISYADYRHWVSAAVDQEANSSSTKSPAIEPLWPSGYAVCLADIAAKVPSYASKSRATKLSVCKELFQAVNTSVLDFLIKSYWYEAYARKLGITISQSTVDAELKKSTASQFKTTQAYDAFLKRNGEVAADVSFRVRVSLTYSALIKRLAPKAKSTSAAATDLDSAATKLYRSRTSCSANYSVSADCGS